MSITIRMAEERDAAAMLAIYAKIVQETAISFEAAPPALSEFVGRMVSVQKCWPWLVLTRDDAVLAYAYASTWRARPAYDWTVESTIYVHESARKQGLGKVLYSALFRCLRVQGYRLAIGGIALPNPQSVALHEALGFVHVGTHDRCGFKFERWWDVGFWQKELAPRDDRAPLAPRSPAEVVDTIEWRRAMQI